MDDILLSQYSGAKKFSLLDTMIILSEFILFQNDTNILETLAGYFLISTFYHLLLLAHHIWELWFANLGVKSYIYQ